MVRKGHRRLTPSINITTTFRGVRTNNSRTDYRTTVKRVGPSQSKESSQSFTFVLTYCNVLSSTQNHFHSLCFSLDSYLIGPECLTRYVKSYIS